MDPSFWHEKWLQNDIGFHEAETNPNLRKYFAHILPVTHARVFVPLCGKTRDIGWLLAQGHTVVGAELSEAAIISLFADLGVAPLVSPHPVGKHYAAHGIDIFVGDIFDLMPDDVGPIDIVYDRAALVALPAEVRPRYGQQIMRLTDKAPQLLLSFEYDQKALNGPPFSVDLAEITKIYPRKPKPNSIVNSPTITYHTK